MALDSTQTNRQSGLSEDYLKSVSESQLKDRAYTPYDLEKYERDSLEEIRKSLKKGKYKTKEDIQDSLGFIEKLANKMNIAINNEKKENKTAWELETDLGDLRRIFDQLNQMLQSLETKEVDDGLKKQKKKMIIRK
jgi:uncharacterized protein YpuA (DUF1002 family)